MTRLQKKCLIAVAGTHLLVVVMLFCTGFFKSTPKQDDAKLLTMFSASDVEKALSSSKPSAEPPPPKQPEQPPQPRPEPPKQDVQPKQVEPEKVIEHTQPPDKSQPDELKPVVKPVVKPKPPKHEIDPVMVKVTRKPEKPTDNSAAEAAKAAKEEAAKEAKEAQRQREALAKAYRDVANHIKANTASSMDIETPAGASADASDYASIVKTVYTAAWELPNDAASDESNVKVSVTIANDGRVIESHIVERSGDHSLDSSVQRTLDRVTQLEPFSKDSTDKQRTYIINFNLKAKRMLG